MMFEVSFVFRRGSSVRGWFGEIYDDVLLHFSCGCNRIKRSPSIIENITVAIKALFNGHQGSFGVTIEALHNGLKGSFQWPLRLFTLYNGLKGCFALAIKALLQWPLRLFL